MPNWCDNFIRIKVPTQHKDQLLADLEGPGEIWWSTKKWGYLVPNQNLSAHERMQAMAHRKEAQAAFSALNNCPEWFKVDAYDCLYWGNHETLEQHPVSSRVPISIPKKVAWKNKEDYEGWNGNIIDYNRHLTDTKWMPSFSRPEWDEGEVDEDGYIFLDIKCQTPWCPPSDPISHFREDLIRANAEMTWIFQCEGDHNIGGWCTEKQEISFYDEVECTTEEQDEFDDEPYEVVDYAEGENVMINAGMPTDMVDGLLS